MTLQWQLTEEASVSSQLDTEIRGLLVSAYPQYQDIFSRSSYWGTLPQFRLLGREPGSLRLLAHLEGGPRLVWVAGQPVSIFGIGAVSVHPSCHRRGHGKEMFRQLRGRLPHHVEADFGFLECRPAVAPFYRSAGFSQVPQPCTSIDPDTGLWETYTGPVMVLPLRQPMARWPGGGEVNLRGQPW